MDIVMLIGSLVLWLIPICLFVFYVFDLDIVFFAYIVLGGMGLAVIAKLITMFKKK